MSSNTAKPTKRMFSLLVEAGLRGIVKTDQTVQMYRLV